MGKHGKPPPLWQAIAILALGAVLLAGFIAVVIINPR